MCVDAHVASGSTQALSLTVGNVLLCFGVAVLLGHAKVDNMDQIGVLCVRTSHQEVVWLDIAINQILLVNCLDAIKLR